MARGNGFEVGPVLSHTLFASTLFIGTAAWFTAFIGQCVYEKDYHDTIRQTIGNSKASAVGVGWFGIFLQIFLIIGVFYTLATDSIAVFRFQIAVFTAVALVFSVLMTNDNIYSDNSSQKAVAAGYLILSMVNIVWLLYFTSEEDSSLYSFLNSFASSSSGRRINGMNISGPSRRSHRASSLHMGNGSTIGSGVGSGYGGYSGVKPGSAAGSIHNGSSGNVAANGGNMGQGQPLMQQQNSSTTQTNTASAASPPDYTIRARALYNYTASPDDPNEISFSKGEELEIIDNSGKWWQARNSSGKVGIAPSNYLSVIA